MQEYIVAKRNDEEWHFRQAGSNIPIGNLPRYQQYDLYDLSSTKICLYTCFTTILVHFLALSFLEFSQIGIYFVCMAIKEENWKLIFYISVIILCISVSLKQLCLLFLFARSQQSSNSTPSPSPLPSTQGEIEAHECVAVTADILITVSLCQLKVEDTWKSTLDTCLKMS